MPELAPVTLTKFTILAGIDPVTREISASVNKTTNDVIASVSLGVGRSPELELVGDQISIDGVVSGPHLTGPKGDAGENGDQRLFVQSTQPDFGGDAGVWIQTGMANDGFTIWIEDGAQ